jgi:hypothetical protein
LVEVLIGEGPGGAELPQAKGAKPHRGVLVLKAGKYEGLLAQAL